MEYENESPLSELKPRKVLGVDEISALLTDMKSELQAAQAIGYFERMELNHDTRFAWWPGQSNDGKKWSSEERMSRLLPGQEPSRKVFPWEGSSDARVRLVDGVIREHNMLKQLAVDRRQQRIGPRNLSPDEDPQAMAALWGQVAEYYEDLTKDEARSETRRWPDIAHEYGNGILFCGWRAEMQLVPKTITVEMLTQIAEQVAVQAAQQQAAKQWEADGGDPEAVPELDGAQQFLIAQDAEVKLQEMIEDDEQRALLVARLLEVDPEMPKDEAQRMARLLKLGEPVEYFAVTTGEQQPELRALTYGIDVFFPALTKSLKRARWVCMPEWVSDVELRKRINNPKEPYDETWVEAVLGQPGKALDLGVLGTGNQQSMWILSGGGVRCGVNLTDLEKLNSCMFQILHVYYVASAVGNVPALYHTVLHGTVPTMAGYHECCEHYHARMPFFEHLTDQEAPYILASEGYGEKSLTDQQEVKTQRDSRSDDASLRIKPPLEVPFNQSKKVNWRPGEQIPIRSTAGMGIIRPMNAGSDARGSQEIENTTRTSFNEYWFRGATVDPDMKQAFRQLLVSDFLHDLAKVKQCVFQLIQQFAPEEIKASFVGGLAANLSATREQIQGRVAIELDYDVNELDPDRAKTTIDSLVMLRQLDPENLMNYAPLLKACVSYLMPAHYKTLVSDPNKRQQEETQDEQDIVGRILGGTLFDEQGSYVEGTNHALRLKIDQQIFGVQTDAKGVITMMVTNGPDGQPSRAQRLFESDPEVKALVMNRLKFHARQLQQQQNAVTGRQLVQPVDDKG